MMNPGGRAETKAESQTAVDGTFSFRLRRGALVDLRVVAAGYVAQTVPDAQAGERMDVVLIRGGIDLTVEVVDEEGRPIAGAEVRVFTIASESGGLVDRLESSDANGRAPFPATAPSLTLHAQAWRSGFGDAAWARFICTCRCFSIAGSVAAK